MTIDTSPISVVSFVVPVLNHQFVAEKPGGLCRCVGNQRFLLRQFKLELLLQKHFQALLDFLRFFLWPGKSQAEVICIPHEPKPPVVRIKWITLRELLTLPPQFQGFLSIALLALILLSYPQSIVFRVPLSLFFSCVCWKQCLFNVLVQPIQIDIAEYW